jgi:hypothetical protein
MQAAVVASAAEVFWTPGGTRTRNGLRIETSEAAAKHYVSQPEACTCAVWYVRTHGQQYSVVQVSRFKVRDGSARLVGVNDGKGSWSPDDAFVGSLLASVTDGGGAVWLMWPILALHLPFRC